MTLREERRGTLTLSIDNSRLDVEFIHRFLSEEAYWALGRSRNAVVKSIEASLCVGAYESGRQIAFARVITDSATFAWLCDVFVAAAERRKGVARALVGFLLEDPRLAGVRVLLGTKDAHTLYKHFGFEPVAEPGRFMAKDWKPAARS